MGLLAKLIAKDKANKIKIAVIGDSMRDEYVHGRFEAAQENCPKFVETSRVVLPGGAANAAKSIGHWNAEPWLFSITGGNIHYDVPLGNSKVKSELSLSQGNVCLKERFIIDGKVIFRHDKDFMDTLPIEDFKRVIIGQLVCGGYGAVLISDYNKGFMSAPFIKRMIEVCNANKIPVVADAKRDPRTYAGSIIKANTAYTKTFPQYFAPAVVTNAGDAGPDVFDGKNGWQQLPMGKPVPCVNHVGAGDCFSAHLALALGHGFDLMESAAIAHEASRVYVQHPHNRAPWPHEIHRQAEMIAGKLICTDDIPALRQSVNGQLVFTNGVFRVGPHAGHAWLMDWAKRQGDVLAVGVNTCGSAKALRNGQYILNFVERFYQLAAMDAVDWIIPFDGPDPSPEIEMLRPHILVKGFEYAGQSIPGDKIVGDVRFAPPGPFPERRSTNFAAELQEYVSTQPPQPLSVNPERNP